MYLGVNTSANWFNWSGTLNEIRPDLFGYLKLKQ